MSGFISALNIAYEERETRGFIRLNLLAVGLTVGMIIGGLFCWRSDQRQSEKQTRVDSTEGPPKPMGQRGAVVADTLGGIRE
jgi:hypothetical protein